MQFLAEIKKISSRKTVSNDIEFEVVLRTNDVTALSLGAINAETMVKVAVEEE